jgi:hypothetical protein
MEVSIVALHCALPTTLPDRRSRGPIFVASHAPVFGLRVLSAVAVMFTLHNNTHLMLSRLDSFGLFAIG